VYYIPVTATSFINNFSYGRSYAVKKFFCSYINHYLADWQQQGSLEIKLPADWNATIAYTEKATCDEKTTAYPKPNASR